jgi:shikimate dehydrogenase
VTAPVSGTPGPLSGSTSLYAILGDPIAQVASPRLFNEAFQRRGIDAVLVAMHVPPAALRAQVEAFRVVRNFAGLVVTVPHKIEVSSLVDRLGRQARSTGALNAIAKDGDGSLVGENFDGVGFVRGLDEAGHRIAGRRVLVVGAGGAGRAVAHALAGAGIAALGIADVDAGRRASLLASLREVAPDLEVTESRATAEGFDAVVNCTPVGMREDDPFPLDVSALGPSHLVADIVLKPSVTRLLREAATRGCATQPGLPMLEGQVDAVIDFLLHPGSSR